MDNSKISYELANACFLLFGPLFHFSNETLTYLKPSGIKSAYRSKAKLYHPDSTKLSKKSKQELSILFNELNNAYKLLLSYIENKIKLKKFNYFFLLDNNSNKKRNDFYYKGELPKRKLRLGEYLYYSKKISWKTLIDAIVSQYNTRPKIGDLCLKLNFLNINEINKIINNINIQEKFGDAAKRLGLLNEYQILAVLGTQKKFNRPIGIFFTEKNIFTNIELELFNTQCKKHNINFRANPVELKN